MEWILIFFHKRLSEFCPLLTKSFLWRNLIRCLCLWKSTLYIVQGPASTLLRTITEQLLTRSNTSTNKPLSQLPPPPTRVVSCQRLGSTVTHTDKKSISLLPHNLFPQQIRSLLELTSCLHSCSFPHSFLTSSTSDQPVCVLT